MDLHETIVAIEDHGLQQQKLGDIHQAAGRFGEANACYLRAKVAREEKLLYHSVTEASDPAYCRSIQGQMGQPGLLTSADLYKLGKWGDFTPGQV
jgi:hypothetical protein